MKSTNILAKNFSHEVQKYLQENEEVEWEGQPKPKFSISLLEMGGHHDVLTGPTSILGFIVGGMLVAGYLFYLNNNWIALAATIIVGIIIIVFPDIIKNERKKNTQYVVTNNRVFFQLWRWGKKSMHVIDLADVGQITYEADKDQSGVVHFLPRKSFDFFTHDFVSGKQRFYPTFEMIPDVIELQKKLEALRKDRLRRTIIGNKL